MANETELAAKKALVRFLKKNPGSKPGDILDHFFPPSKLAFTQPDLSGAFVQMMSDGELTADSNWALTLAEEG